MSAVELPQTLTGEVGSTDVVIQVATDGDDAADGSVTAPVGSLARALELALEPLAAGRSTTILLAPGRYREGGLVLKAQEHGPAVCETPLVIAAAQPGSVQIMGSVTAGWQADSWEATDEPDVYRHAWPYDWGMVAVPNNEKWHQEPQHFLRRRELLVVGGTMLTQRLHHADLTPNSFHVDDAAGTVSIKLAPGAPLADRGLIEVATHEFLLEITHKSNLALRNLDFEHTASWILDTGPGARGWGNALLVNSWKNGDDALASNLLLDGCRVRVNNSSGARIVSHRNVVIRDCHFDDNGWKGLGLSHNRDIAIVDTSFDRNGWRSLWGANKGLDAAGIKCVPNNHGLSFLRVRAVGNEAPGIWLDWDNRDVAFERCLLEDNLGSALVMEASPGPVTISGCVIRNNRAAAINGHGVSRVTVEGCAVYGNHRAVFYIISDPRKIDDWELVCKNWTLTDNLFAAKKDEMWWAVRKWPEFLASYSGSGNTWMVGHEHTTEVFPASDGTKTSLEQWQAAGRELGSTVARGVPQDDERMTLPQVAP